MAPRSSIEKLPDEIREAAYALLRAGRTVDEITSHLHELGAEISRSGVGRWKKSAEKSMKALQRAQAFGAHFAKSLKEDPEGKVSRMLIELGNTALLDRMLDRADDGEDGTDARPIDEKALFLLSAAVKNFASAGNMNVARELKIRDTVLKKAADEAGKVAKARGLTPEAVAEIRSKILGVAA